MVVLSMYTRGCLFLDHIFFRFLGYTLPHSEFIVSVLWTKFLISIWLDIWGERVAKYILNISYYESIWVFIVLVTTMSIS